MELDGAGEILVNSLDRDGTNSGFDIELLNAICSITRVPVIASSGGGSVNDFVEVFRQTEVSAALGARLFHSGQQTSQTLKAELDEYSIRVRKVVGLDFDKFGGLIPVTIQDNHSLQVLMTGFMNRVAYDETLQRGKVVFWSRTKGRLWEKGEESGNCLHVVTIATDCDNDALLFKVIPDGPTCHTGSVSCFS
jgi:phosphoribosyl-AMP cyclohydrolase